MKGLIIKILKEEVGYPTGVDKTPIGEDAISRLRIVFTKMKEGKGWDAYLSQIDKTKKIPSSMYDLTGGLWTLLKYMGIDTDQRMLQTQYIYYWFATTFMKNGGYGRDFKEGEIQLVELPVFEMEGQYTEEQYAYKTGWGDIIGVSGEEEAINIFKDNIDNYIEDSEEDDKDYGGSYDVENVIINNVKFIKFDPSWVGL